MTNIRFYVFSGLLFVATTVNASEAYIPADPEEHQNIIAPKTDTELDVAIRQVLKEIDEKLIRIDRKIKEIQIIISRIDTAIADMSSRVLCEALAQSAGDIRKLNEQLHSLKDDNERKKAEDRLNLLKTVHNEQNEILKEKKVSCSSQ